MVKIAGIAAQTEILYLGLRKGKHFKNLFAYGVRLIHTIEVLGISIVVMRKMKNIQELLKKPEIPLHSMTTAKNSLRRTAAPFDS